MIIPEDFLFARFTEVNLLHILILLGIPYLIFYIFERFTNFDKFGEKWEAGLFIFAFGGLVSFLSIILGKQLNISFYLPYTFLLFILTECLFVLYLSKRNFKKQEPARIRIKLKNGNRYVGFLLDSDKEFIRVGSNINYPIEKIDEKEQKKQLKAKEILISRKEIYLIYIY